MNETHFDVIVIGSGPAGHGAALSAAHSKKRVVVIEQERNVGGACVTHGTIPSKTLRETAIALSAFRKKSGDAFRVETTPNTQVVALMRRLSQVITAHERVMETQLNRAGVHLRHGRTRFTSTESVAVRDVHGVETQLFAPVIVIATGSRPRNPKELTIDHEHVLDSDSILSMAYLPRSLIVLGAGVIACEYASIFATLGVKVTIADKGAGPLGFLEPELVERFLRSFHAHEGETEFGSGVAEVQVDAADGVRMKLASGKTLVADKVLAAVGRIANIRGLGLETVGIKPNARGVIEADADCYTGVAKIYAAGDVIGPPSLAASSMEQGRRAVCHALGRPVPIDSGFIPTGVYTIPELASVGLTEAQARERYAQVVVGRAPFEELARGQIAAIDDGILKLVVDAGSRKVVGVHVSGEGAAELVTVGQVAISSGWEVERFVETTFNFPTLAEAYRVAALDVLSAQEEKTVTQLRERAA
jgi:NAD(P) transhydrogenase